MRCAMLLGNVFIDGGNFDYGNFEKFFEVALLHGQAALHRPGRDKDFLS
jgi:hypothetical protein